MKTELPNLITPDASAGLALAGRLAEQLHEQFTQAAGEVDHPGGMNYRVPAEVPREVICGVLFYAITAANHGWLPDAKA
jgi:hypothetical protein